MNLLSKIFNKKNNSTYKINKKCSSGGKLDINNQAKILIGALSKNIIPNKVAFNLAYCLNIEEISKIAINDKELSEAFTQLYSTLFFERKPDGGILDFADSIGYLKVYLEYINKCQFEEFKFISLKYVCDFLNTKENKEEMIQKYDSNIYEQLVSEFQKLWNDINVISCLNKVINMDDKYIYDAVNYIEQNKVFELIPNLEKAYLEGSKCSTLEMLLCEVGSNNIKNHIYEELKKEYNFRKNKKLCYDDLFDEESIKRAKILYKIGILEWECAHDYELINKLIEDYDLDIRENVLEVLYKDSNYMKNSDIQKKVIDRLNDNWYVRVEALEVCKKYDLKITDKQKQYILKQITKREGYNDEVLEYEKNLSTIIN